MIDPIRKEEAKSYPIIELALRLGLILDRNNFCRCINPNHEDKHPSMSFDRKNNIFKCFGCDFSGDTISLVIEMKKITYTQAIYFILEGNWTQHSSTSKNALDTALNPSKNYVSESGEQYSDIYEYLTEQLSHLNDKHYLVTDRKLSLEVLIENNIKALRDKQQFWNIYNKAKELFTEERVKRSGISSLCECIAIVPFYEDDKIVYIQGLNPKFKRLLKGINKKDLYFPKDFTTNDSKKDILYVVEGVIDVLSSSTLGYKAIGIMDAGISNFSEFDKIKNFSIVLLGDAPDFDS